VIVAALHSGAGLPKPGATRLVVDAGGVRGDVNRYRWDGRGGDPGMAVSLYSVELAATIADAGWSVVNVDVVVSAEAPHLAPHLGAMASALGAAVGAPVGVKAKRGEGVGAVGRGEAIVAWAVALLDAAEVPEGR